MHQIAELTGLDIEKVRLIVHLVNSRKIREHEMAPEPSTTISNQEQKRVLDELVDYYAQKI